MIRILDFEDAAGLITRKAVRLEEAERIVAPILSDVRNAAIGRCSNTRASSMDSRATAFGCR